MRDRHGFSPRSVDFWRRHGTPLQYLPGESPWQREPVGYHPIQRVRHSWSDFTHTYTQRRLHLSVELESRNEFMRQELGAYKESGSRLGKGQSVRRQDMRGSEEWLWGQVEGRGGKVMGRISAALAQEFVMVSYRWVSGWVNNAFLKISMKNKLFFQYFPSQMSGLRKHLTCWAFLLKVSLAQARSDRYLRRKEER